ncbi:MAG: Type secretion system hydrolase TadA/VirB11/CpaF, TadA subfamily [Labilithrix sp.]|nr:Type secretion system hydrolase TadA/VirB11/CpaF, TadA subfamily [Labilithrix sp.]
MISTKIFEKTLLSFFAPIRPYLDDPTVSEIMINGPDCIYVERRGQLARVDARFDGPEALTAAIRNLSQYVGKPISASRPILEGRLPDGSRVEAILPPVSPDGPHVSIRRFFKEALTVERLVGFESLTRDAADALQAFVVAKCNILVAGGTGSGKTSMLNALSGFIPDGERVVVIEDSREVQFQKPHVVQLEARPADAHGEGAVSIRDIFRATLRMRPDRVVVGEIRGGEALDIVQAMTSGHGGCMGTLHATYPRDTLTRMETMAMMSDVEMPLAAMRAQIGSGIQIIVQVARLQDGTRKVTHITEVAGFDAVTQAYVLRDLFVRRYADVVHGCAVQSRLVATGLVPACKAQLDEHGVSLPGAMRGSARGEEVGHERSL